FLHDELNTSIDQVQRDRVGGLKTYILASGWASLMIYGFISVMCLLAASGTLFDAVQAASYTIIFLYMLLPLDALLNNISSINLAWIGLERIGAVLEQTQEAEPVGAPQALAYQHLALVNVSHQYYREAEDNLFTLGPITLHFQPGELVFLVGGNGSGKTSLAKLIVGLYTPQQGHIELNGQLLAPDQQDNYRQLFSAVFSDFHLFESLHRLEENCSAEALDRSAQYWIERLQLAHKVSIRNGRFSTQALSQGQRKRLALVVAYLEDRPFYLFDEWAADQDPVFKQVFYQELLPELRAAGKTVLVVTHDDRYFPVADRCLKLENGQLIEPRPAVPA
ncbi:MAG: cyclic peptide export ABC transporter, partial [Oceanospirillales bacterium]|nr:cyclic peptide export ABC transporter [Oceanospirillales bacterium]